MLRNFRSVFKGQQTPMTIVMGVVAVGLLAYLAPSRGNELSGDRVVGRVFGREITFMDLHRAMDELQQRMGQRGNTAAMRPFLQGQAMQQLLGERLWEELAERHHIVITDQEVRDHLESLFRSAPGFTNPDGSLKSTAEIEELLAGNRQKPMTLLMLEKDTRRQLMVAKLKSQASALVPVDEAWVALEHRIRNEKLTLETWSLPVEPANVKDPGDAALQTFMTSQGARFQVGPRRVLQVVSVDKASFGTSLNPDEKALKAAYEAKKANYVELKARHILLKVEKPDELPAAQKAIAEIQEKLKAGADFTQLAEQFSQDPSAQANKGDLGWFKQGAMVKPFWDGALALKPGEVSGVVKTNFGLHLIKLDDRREKALDEVKDELKTQLVQERYVAKAKEKLEDLRKRAGKGDLANAAKAMNLTVSLSKPLLDEPGVKVEGLNGSENLVSEGFRLKVGENSTVQRAGDKFAVVRVHEEKPSAIPPMAEIREKVLSAYREEEGRKALKVKVEAILARNSVSELGTMTPVADKSIQEMGELGQNPAIRKALLNTAEGKTTPLLWNAEGRIWVAKVTSRKAATPLTFASRQALVREIQDGVANQLLMGELQAMFGQGRERRGFSSLWGRMGGVWTDEDFLKARSAAAAATEDSE